MTTQEKIQDMFDRYERSKQAAVRKESENSMMPVK